MASPEEEISRNIASNFIRTYLPTHEIVKVPRDGFCIIHAFRESLIYAGNVQSFDEVVGRLRKELTDRESFYSSNCAENTDVVHEFEEDVQNPLSKYNKDITDLFLYALGCAYQVNVILFESDANECRITHQTDENIAHRVSCYFVRTLSLHWDPVLPIVVDESDESESEVIVTKVVNPDIAASQDSSADSDIEITAVTQKKTHHRSSGKMKIKEFDTSEDEFCSSKPFCISKREIFNPSSSDDDEAGPPFCPIIADGVITSPVTAEVHHNYRFQTVSLGEYYSILSESNILANPAIIPSSVVPMKEGLAKMGKIFGKILKLSMGVCKVGVNCLS